MTAKPYPRRLIDPRLGVRTNLLNLLPDPPEMAFPLKRKLTVKQAEQWQRKARPRLAAVLGGPMPKVARRVKVLERKQLDGYRRTMFVMDTLPGIAALCWYCVPDDMAKGERRPGMVATPGHGIGARDILAMTEDGKPRPEGEGYQKDYALQAVRLGYPTLVVEPMGFGERCDPDRHPNQSGCHTGVTVATMLGTTLAGIRAHDLRCAGAWLARQPEVRPSEIGLMGISGGGQMTLFTAALDKRFKVAICSGYLSHYNDSILGLYHCVCNFLPNLGRNFDMPDIAAMIAPRPMLIQSGTKDHIFPIKASRAAYKHTQQIYDVWGARDKLAQDVFVGDHQWSSRSVTPFLKRELPI